MKKNKKNTLRTITSILTIAQSFVTIILIMMLLGILGIGIFEFMLKQGNDFFDSIMTLGIITGGIGMIIGGISHKLFDNF